MVTASPAPPWASISETSDKSLSPDRAATATRAPASASASAVALPIPCDAPVTRATLSFSENIRLTFRRFGPRLGDLFDRGLKRRSVFHVQNAHGTVDLPHQPGQ